MRFPKDPDTCGRGLRAMPRGEKRQFHPHEMHWQIMIKHALTNVDYRLFRPYSFGHLLKTVELVEDQIPFFWYPSTENGRLRRLQITFIKSHSFGHSVFGRLPRDF